jgi:oxygen-independent coproporphyrinogen-3 oxidase
MIQKTLDGIIVSLESSLNSLVPGNIATVFIGGGTPSLVSPDLLDNFLSRLSRIIGTGGEFTIEVNPESLTRNFIDVLNAHPVNRISMGVQSYDEHLLSWLGRPAGREAIDRADSLLSAYWSGSLSRDLLAGLPRPEGPVHHPRRLLEDINLALEDNPGHLSMYELTVEKGTALADSAEDLRALPDEQEALEEWFSAVEFLRQKGYRRYEISNFALKGKESSHNMNYWRMNPYLGIGPGAVSTLPVQSALNPDAAAVRRQEPADLLLWIKNPAGSFREEVLKPGELALEHFMMALRTSEGLSGERFEKIFGMKPENTIPESLRRWTESGMLMPESLFIRPTPGGMDLLDSILADIAAEIDKTDWSGYCRWPQT